MIGETLGSYRIISLLGAGAMGEVYLAEHRHLKRKAAVKLLAPGMVGRPDLLERFFMEARATSTIAHPGIVQIFDCEVDASGRPYIVMEYLSGETLAARLGRSRPLPAMLAARLTQAMASALDAAHAKGIVHRDLKPENVFVDPGPPESIKLVDFGIAKLAGEIRAEQVHQTRTGSLMGTPLYMSPEQCRDSAKIDFRTDIYSLGCVMFEMLTGRPPFAWDALGDLVVAHLTEAPKDVRELNPAVPAPLAELCAALLQKDPAARPATMAQVGERVGNIIARATTVPSATSPVANTAVAVQPPTNPSFLEPDGRTEIKNQTKNQTTTKTKTTFGEAAAEVLDQVEPVERKRRRGMLLAAVAIAAAVAAGVMVFGRTRSAEPVAAATPTQNVAHLPEDHPGTVPNAAAVAPSMVADRDTDPVARQHHRRAEPSLASGPNQPTVERDTAHTKKIGGSRQRRSESASPASAGPSRAVPLSAPTAQANSGVPVTQTASIPPPAKDTAHTTDLAGAWEGPWTDPNKHQQGRLYLQVGRDGAVSGWMFNGAAQQSFRLVGRMASEGALNLTCQCSADRAFSAHGNIRAVSEGELAGQVALSSASGTFGQSHFTLRRTTPR